MHPGADLAYPNASDADRRFFDEHGYLVVPDAVDLDDLTELRERCDRVIADRENLAYDWAWEAGTSKETRAFKILQASLSELWPDFVVDTPYCRWAAKFGSSLMAHPMEFWYDQFLAKPPGIGAATLWHQDEAYWGRNLDDRGITCWMPFHDVDQRNGCMHFIDGGHRLGVLTHRQPPDVQSDLVTCDVDETKAIAAPVAAGSVTFHHSKTPHMTTANETDRWRMVLTQHLRMVGVEGEGDHYPWKIYVDQHTGQRVRPASG
jgi:phytanoyl-CoA hydroxylase